MIILISLLFVAFVFIIVGHFKGAEIILSPITGMMFGFLYHKEEYENENAAIEGKDPTTQDADIQELKIENVKYKLKEVISNE